MKNLLKSDFYRLLKSKLTIISLIIAVVLPLLTTLMFFGIFELIKYLDPEGASSPLFGNMGARYLIGTCFSFTDNFGIVLPIFAAIFIIFDVTSGTIRNKLILGYKRHQIFASHFLVVLTYSFVMMIIYAGMTTLWGSVILGLGEITSEQVTSLIYYYILGLLSYAFVASVATFYSLSLLSSAGSIILTLVTCLLVGLVSTIISAFDYSSFEHFANFLPCFVMSTFMAKDITITAFLEALGGIVLFSGIFFSAGVFIFSKRDLK